MRTSNILDEKGTDLLSPRAVGYRVIQRILFRGKSEVFRFRGSYF